MTARLNANRRVGRGGSAAVAGPRWRVSADEGEVVVRRGVLIVVALSGSIALAACGGAQTKPGDSPTSAAAAAAAAAATATATASPTTSAPAASASAQPMSPQLTAALNALSEKARALTAPADIRDKIQAGNDALGVARASVNRMRDNAYGTAKNCSVVFSQRSVVISNTSAASGNGSSALQLLNGRRPGISALTDATNQVEAVVQAEGTPIEALPSIQQAVASARKQVSDENDSMSNLTDGANALISNARDVRSNSDQISGKAC